MKNISVNCLLLQVKYVWGLCLPGLTKSEDSCASQTSQLWSLGISIMTQEAQVHVYVYTVC